MDRIFQNIRADFLDILEIREVRGDNFGNFGIEFGRADRHPSDDRPCTTTQLRGHGLSTGGDHIYVYIYIHIHTENEQVDDNDSIRVYNIYICLIGCQFWAVKMIRHRIFRTLGHPKRDHNSDNRPYVHRSLPADQHPFQPHRATAGDPPDVHSRSCLRDSSCSIIQSSKILCIIL